LRCSVFSYGCKQKRVEKEEVEMEEKEMDEEDDLIEFS